MNSRDMLQVGLQDRARVMDNEGDNQIYCKVSLSINMSNNIRRTFLKKERDVAKKKVYWP